METTRLRTDKLRPATAAQITAMQDAGASPREQIDAARKIQGQKLNYLPHQSTREIERRRKRAERTAAK